MLLLGWPGQYRGRTRNAGENRVKCSIPRVRAPSPAGGGVSLRHRRTAQGRDRAARQQTGRPDPTVPTPTAPSAARKSHCGWRRTPRSFGAGVLAPMASVRCIFCGTSNSDRDAFCRLCRSPLRSLMPEATNVDYEKVGLPRGPRRVRAVLIAIALVLLVAATALGAGGPLGDLAARVVPGLGRPAVSTVTPGSRPSGVPGGAAPATQGLGPVVSPDRAASGATEDARCGKSGTAGGGSSSTERRDNLPCQTHPPKTTRDARAGATPRPAGTPRPTKSPEARADGGAARAEGTASRAP